MRQTIWLYPLIGLLGLLTVQAALATGGCGAAIGAVASAALLLWWWPTPEESTVDWRFLTALLNGTAIFAILVGLVVYLTQPTDIPLADIRAAAEPLAHYALP